MNQRVEERTGENDSRVKQNVINLRKLKIWFRKLFLLITKRRKEWNECSKWCLIYQMMDAWGEMKKEKRLSKERSERWKRKKIYNDHGFMSSFLLYERVFFENGILKIYKHFTQLFHYHSFDTYSLTHSRWRRQKKNISLRSAVLLKVYIFPTFNGLFPPLFYCCCYNSWPTKKGLYLLPWK